MTEEELREVTTIVRDEMRLAFDQQNEMMVRFVTLIERLTDRVEVLELERLHVQGCTPIAPPALGEG